MQHKTYGNERYREQKQNIRYGVSSNDLTGVLFDFTGPTSPSVSEMIHNILVSCSLVSPSTRLRINALLCFIKILPSYTKA